MFIKSRYTNKVHAKSTWTLWTLRRGHKLGCPRVATGTFVADFLDVFLIEEHGEIALEPGIRLAADLLGDLRIVHVPTRRREAFQDLELGRGETIRLRFVG